MRHPPLPVSGIIVNVTHNASKIANNLFFIFIFSSC